MADKQKPKPPVNESGRPEDGGGEGRQDVVGHVPDDIRIDPDITEGHPGYEESGDSETSVPGQAKQTDARKRK
jgi:hypothetical protein